MNDKANKFRRTEAEEKYQQKKFQQNCMVKLENGNSKITHIQKITRTRCRTLKIIE